MQILSGPVLHVSTNDPFIALVLRDTFKGRMTGNTYCTLINYSSHSLILTLCESDVEIKQNNYLNNYY